MRHPRVCIIVAAIILSSSGIRLNAQDKDTALRHGGIENRRWRIAKYRGNSSQQTDEEGLIEAKARAEITFHYRIEGSAGCGALEGDYKLSGDHLTIHADFALYGFCYPEQEVQNRMVISALKRSVRIEQRDDGILLRDRAGQIQILLVPY